MYGTVHYHNRDTGLKEPVESSKNNHTILRPIRMSHVEKLRLFYPLLIFIDTDDTYIYILYIS